MLTRIQGENCNFKVLEFLFNTLITAIMNKMPVITTGGIHRCNRSFNLSEKINLMPRGL